MGVGDVGVNLSGTNVGVAEESLDRADVSAVHEEVGSEGMAEGVGCDMLGDASCASVLLDHTLDAARSETTVISGSINGLEVFAVIEKEGGKGIVTSRKIVSYGIGGGLGDENGTILVSFSPYDELTALEIDGVAIEPDKLGDAEATGEEELDDGAVAETGLGI